MVLFLMASCKLICLLRVLFVALEFVESILASWNFSAIKVINLAALSPSNDSTVLLFVLTCVSFVTFCLCTFICSYIDVWQAAVLWLPGGYKEGQLYYWAHKKANPINTISHTHYENCHLFNTLIRQCLNCATWGRHQYYQHHLVFRKWTINAYML